MAKQYKPGQFVWINGKQHRVTKASSKIVCNSCSYKEGHTCINPERGKKFPKPIYWICLSLPQDCYPKPI